MPIQVLDQNTINKIAAGEVIERPSSVVKELVENAIDAKATAITVEIKDGGITFIRITDNGAGINSSEIPVAFLRHSTSKIKSVEDLMSVSSLGFRGEALSSIAAVSQVELITKTKDSFNGSRYVIEGGKSGSVESVGAPDGTTFIIRNLFYNTPVRRKFLKTATTEGSYVSGLIEHLALSHPDISFRFINNGQNKLHTSGNGNIKDIIYHLYGRDVAANMIEVNSKTQDIEINGFIGKPLISRGNRTYENYYINGRYIKSSVINRALEDGYKGYIMMHRYPFVALHLKINSQIIDVNVHPTKMELRFAQNERVYDFMLNTIKAALSKRELIPSVSVTNEDAQKKVESKNSTRLPEPFEVNRSAKTIAPVQTPIEKPVPKSDTVERPVIKQTPIEKPVPKPESIEKTVDKVADKSVVYAQPTENIVPQPAQTVPPAQTVQPSQTVPPAQTVQPAPQSKPQQLELFDGEDRFLDKASKAKHKIIGQLFDTYWIIEFEDKMFIMDQHAAHEKILFEKTMQHLRESKVDSQLLNPPIILTLNMREQEVLKMHMESFEKVGYEIEEFGGNEYKVVATPASLPGINSSELLIEILDNLSIDNPHDNSDMIIEKVASMSCKAAVKGNNRLSYEEADTLISQLMEADNPYNCPHGRPTLISMSKYEIEKKFKRIV